MTLSYYGNDDLQSVAVPGSITRTYTYKTNGPADTITVSGPSGLIAQLAYGYDEALRPTALTDGDGLHQYTYDDLDRLTQATHPIGSGLPATEAYTYTAAGDRKDPAAPSAWTYDANHRIATSPGLTYTFNADGGLSSRSDGLTLTYDARQRLVQLVKAGTTSSYVHDPMGRRIRKIVGSQTTWFLWDGTQLLAEYDGSGSRIKRYAYLADGDRAQLQDVNGTYYIHADRLGTPRLITNAGAQVIWSARYEAYGTAQVNEDADSNGVPVQLNVRFAGQYYDSETGFHYNYFRDYDPAMGRYIESDPIGLVGGINTYGYVDGNPISLIDPLGLLCRRGERTLRSETIKDLSRRRELGELRVPFIGPVHAELGIQAEPSTRSPGWRPGVGANLSWDIIHFVWKRYEIREGYIHTRSWNRKYYCKADDPCQKPQEWVEVRPDGLDQDLFYNVYNEWRYSGAEGGYTTATP
jgi:RHS repeat-associated protein